MYQAKVELPSLPPQYVHMGTMVMPSADCSGSAMVPLGAHGLTRNSERTVTCQIHTHARCRHRLCQVAPHDGRLVIRNSNPC